MSKPLRSQPTRDRILEAARRVFAEQGYERTTIRGVAAIADIHPSMVMRYYQSKEGLFAAAATFDLHMPDLGGVARGDIGRALVRHFLQRWGGEGADLPALLRVAATHDQARERLARLFEEQVAPAIASICPPQDIRTCAALIATQMLGLAYTRYVLRLPAVTELADDVLVEHVGATLQAYLDWAPDGRQFPSENVIEDEPEARPLSGSS